MSLSVVTCCNCGKSIEKETSHINRAKKLGMLMFCNRECAGLHRRVNKTTEQKKAEKREYDKQYRLNNQDLLKEKKAAWFKKTYNPEEARVKRKERSEIHNEYCRRPEYKVWKKKYDRKYRAQKTYGEYWECFVVTMEIRDECLTQSSAYEIRRDNGTLNKSQRRKRNDRINSN